CEDPNIDQFESLWEQTVSCWHGRICDSQIVRDFITLAKRKKFEWSWIEAFWKSMRQDLKKYTYKTFTELESYMYGSAEVIGLMMARILDLPPKAEETAMLQGKAMQYVNFIRDVDEDEKLGRNYLGYSEAIRHDPQQWNDFLRKHIDAYKAIQRQAEKGFIYIPKSYRAPIRASARLYEQTADTIYQNPMIVWEKKIKPHKLRVILEVIKHVFL
ncbi:MAG: phytoene/squalene synthase family protein, partial [Patescibacteria group bacterium]|nr:phytoene/squalene synthase family protein [Patescibacteria group bacterium]